MEYECISISISNSISISISIRLKTDLTPPVHLESGTTHSAQNLAPFPTLVRMKWRQHHVHGVLVRVAVKVAFQYPLATLEQVPVCRCFSTVMTLGAQVKIVAHLALVAWPTKISRPTPVASMTQWQQQQQKQSQGK